MTRTHDLVLAWTMDNRAWIDRCFQFFSGSDALWRRVGVPDPGCLFQFVHSGTGTDSLTRRLSPGTEIRVTAFASHDLVVTVSSVHRDVYEMLSAYEVANRIGVSHVPTTGTGMAGVPCRSASLIRRVAHLTAADVGTFADDDVVRPELNRVAAAQERQYAERGYAMVEDPVLFFPDDPDCVIPVDAGFFARDPQPRPRAAHGTAVGSQRCTTRIPAKPLVTRLLDARPAWLTSELAASATHLRLFVNVLQDRRSAATTVRLGHPARHSTRPEAGSVVLPVYVPMTDEADSELAARLQRVVRFAETAEVALRRQCGTCRRSSVTAPSCRTTRSRANPLTRPVLSAVGPGAGAVAGLPTGSPRGHAWSCGRCPGGRFTEETIFICPACAGFVSQLDAMDSCPHCGLVPD